MTRPSSIALVLALALAAPALGGCRRATAGTGGRKEAMSGKTWRVVDVGPKAGELRAVLAAEAKKAGELGLKPFVEIGATWCAPCLKLKESLGHPRMADALDGTYLIRLDFDAWSAELPAAGLATTGVPVFFQLGGDGRPTGRRITGEAWSDDTPEGMAPALKKFFRG